MGSYILRRRVSRELYWAAHEDMEAGSMITTEGISDEIDASGHSVYPWYGGND